MARNIDIFSVKARGQYIYQQYQEAEWLKAYGKFIDEYIQENYFDKLKAMWATMDVAESLEGYLTFYTKWYFGLFRPLGGASISDYFDIGLLYDNGRIFDDAQDANGLIQGEQYLKYIKFIYDYTYETWHIDHILAFIADYCDIEPTDIWVDYNFKEECRVLIPSNEKTQDFVKLVINYYDEMCLPFPNIINFLIMADTQEKWRGIFYTPYTEVISLKEWYSPLDKYKAKIDTYSVLYTLFSRFYDKKFRKNLSSYLIDYALDSLFATSEINDNETYLIDEANLSIQANLFTSQTSLQSITFKDSFFYSFAKDSDTGTIAFNGTPKEIAKNTFTLADTTNRVVGIFNSNKAVNFSFTYTIADRIEANGIISDDILFDKDNLSSKAKFLKSRLQVSYTQPTSLFCVSIEMANDLQYSYKASKSVYCITTEVDYDVK